MSFLFLCLFCLFVSFYSWWLCRLLWLSTGLQLWGLFHLQEPGMWHWRVSTWLSRYGIWLIRILLCIRHQIVMHTSSLQSCLQRLFIRRVNTCKHTCVLYFIDYWSRPESKEYLVIFFSVGRKRTMLGELLKRKRKLRTGEDKHGLQIMNLKKLRLNFSRCANRGSRPLKSIIQSVIVHYGEYLSIET